ncbi:restriction endonuclease subunit S, partial [Patescibacteria group bacterium]|nr:restriction endonuclease subunit S [Patescibacteria group bacterium]
MWKTYKLQDLILKTRKVRGIQTKEYQNAGEYPIIDQGSKFIAGYSNDETSHYKDDLPVVIFGDHTLAVKYIDFEFC